MVSPDAAAAFGAVAKLSGEAAFVDGYLCIPVAGESHYRDALRSLRDALDVIGRDGYGFVARLTPEPMNPHDPNAVAVETPGGDRLGYLRADIARDYSAFLASLEGPIECCARLTGGTSERPTIGVVLDFADLAALKQQIGPTAL